MIILKLVLFFVLIFGGIFATITITPNIKNDYLKCMFIVLMIASSVNVKNGNYTTTKNSKNI